MKQQTCDIVDFMYIVGMHITNLHFHQLVCETCLGYSKYHLFSWVYANTEQAFFNTSPCMKLIAKDDIEDDISTHVNLVSGSLAMGQFPCYSSMVTQLDNRGHQLTKSLKNHVSTEY